jgi:hypothetical protein
MAMPCRIHILISWATGAHERAIARGATAEQAMVARDRVFGELEDVVPHSPLKYPRAERAGADDLCRDCGEVYFPLYWGSGCPSCHLGRQHYLPERLSPKGSLSGKRFAGKRERKKKAL